MKIIFVIQARVGSSRFPKKVLESLANNESLLAKISYSIKERFPEHTLFVATSTNDKDGIIEAWCKENDVNCFRGDELSLLKRFYQLSKVENPDYLIRVCADNFFLSLDYMDVIVKNSLLGTFDYISYFTDKNLPAIKTHFGFFVESISNKALEIAYHSNSDAYFQEHLTPYFYENENLFNICKVDFPKLLSENNYIRCTFDDEVDLNIINELIVNLGSNANIEEIVTYVKSKDTIKDKMLSQIKKYSK